jgi:hypothetical protein
MSRKAHEGNQMGNNFSGVVPCSAAKPDLDFAYWYVPLWTVRKKTPPG